MAVTDQQVWLVRLVLVLRRTAPSTSAGLAQSVAQSLPDHSVVRFRRAGPTDVLTVCSPVSGGVVSGDQAVALVRGPAVDVCQSAGRRVAFSREHVTLKGR